MLDLWFVIGLQLGVGGAAGATVIAQGVSGIGITIAALWKIHSFFPKKEQRIFRKTTFFRSGTLRLFTCLAAIRYELWYPDDPGTGKQLRYCDHGSFCRRGQIDTLAYMPVQEFGNAFSLFISQNHGANVRIG